MDSTALKKKQIANFAALRIDQIDLQAWRALAGRPANSIKRLTFWLLRQFGLRLSRLHRAPDWSRSIERLKARGFVPKTIFDIGVGSGTPELYAAFGNAHYYLVDPTYESLAYMQAIATKLKADVFSLALDDHDGERVLDVREDDINHSSLLRNVGSAGPIGRDPVQVRRFDTVIGSFERPALCKIDVQGSEMAVLRGMGARIEEFDIFLIESSTLSVFEGGPEVAEVIGFLKAFGFVLYDILAMVPRPLDGAISQIDLLFVKESAPLRADRRWEKRP